MVAPHQDFNPQCVDHHACVNPPGSIDLKVPLLVPVLGEPGSTGWGPRSIAFSCLKKVAELTLVYGRYNYSIHGGYSVDYKSTIVVILWFYGRYHMI